MKKITILFAFILIFSITTVAYAQVVSFGGLGRGAKGPAVLALQRVLISQGYLGVNFATGNFGPLTVQAVQKFQRAQGLAQVGRVGPATLRALNAISNQGAGSLPASPASPATPATGGSNTTSGATPPPQASHIPTSPVPPPTNPPVPPTPPLPPTTPVPPPVPPVPPPNPPPTTPIPPNPPARPCVPATPAYIKVEMPNGGEVFTFGEQITVRWQTCNYQSRAVSIYLEYFDPNSSTAVVTPVITDLAIGTPNDFGEVVTLPLLGSVAGSGAFYKIAITDGPEPHLATILDESDDLFTIK